MTFQRQILNRYAGGIYAFPKSAIEEHQKTVCAHRFARNNRAHETNRDLNREGKTSLARTARSNGDRESVTDRKARSYPRSGRRLRSHRRWGDSRGARSALTEVPAARDPWPRSERSSDRERGPGSLRTSCRDVAEDRPHAAQARTADHVDDGPCDEEQGRSDRR